MSRKDKSDRSNQLIDREGVEESRTDELGPIVEPEQPAAPKSRIGRLIKRFGVAGFLFFLIKGVVLYILAPLGLFKWFGGCD